MKVLVVTHQFPPDGVGGVERYTESLAEQLAQSGDSVTVLTRMLTPNGVDQIQNEWLPNGTHVIRLPGADPGLDLFLSGSDRLEERFIEVVERFRPDVIHINHLRYFSPASILEARQRAPVVLSLHDFYFACPLIHLRKLSDVGCAGPDGGRECTNTCFAYEGASAGRWGVRAEYFRGLLAAANRIVCPSTYVASYFREFGADPDRLVVIPNGITIRDRTRISSSVAGDQTKLVIAYLGAVTPHKGIHTILEALKVANVGPVEILVLGQVSDGDYARSLRLAAASIPSVVLKFYGTYDPADLPFLLSAVDVVIVPSLVPETFSITAREALSLGVPVIAANIGALPEAVNHDGNGFLFDPEVPAELATLLGRLSREPNLIGRLQVGAAKTPVMSAGEHATEIQRTYRQAIRDYKLFRNPSRSYHAEMADLYSSLKVLGFDRIESST